ncbi:MAG: nucleoside triphosphate pyrophosphatase [Bacillota bacterium]|nr:nucleoside triphosphate pyrophosphatase [Bacillota bacterium]
MTAKKKRIVLASSSPRRRELLRLLGLDFEVVPGGEVEYPYRGGDPAAYAQDLALRKARSVAESVGEGLVIGADTIVLLDGRVLGKPKDEREAEEMLTLLSGRKHQVITGVAVVEAPSGRSSLRAVKTEVAFRPLRREEIQAYIATGEPLDKAGAYGIQGYGAVLVERVEGCYFNVVGLPLATLAEMLRDFGVDVLREVTVGA